MSSTHPLTRSQIEQLLLARGVRPTRQRMALTTLLLGQPSRHVTAEALHHEAQEAGAQVSLATVYNTLNQLRGLGLVREISVTPGRSYFDTNTSHHFHIYHEETGELWDVDPARCEALLAGPLPAGTELSRVDVVYRVRAKR